MDSGRFWELIALLGGRADERTCRTLEAALSPAEGDDLGEEIQRRVDELLDRRSVPASHTGDTAEWIAAAVIAAGRERFERELTQSGPLDPDDWQWEDAESLLVAGFGDDDDPDDGPEAGLDDVSTEALEDGLGLWLQWKSGRLPAGVTTAWDPEVEAALDAPDDPAFGRVPTTDPAWDDALATLAADPEFHRRRALIGDIGLHLLVRDVDGAELRPWPSETEVENVVLTVPAADARTEHDERVADYLEVVVFLVTSTQENLGLEG
ncbi:hypothetical protein [Nocardioides sp.]|uniref:hypothetical protein n=1 Tax=Nocardioides sp. TaxID=35761 RepID=UPI002EDB0769